MKSYKLEFILEDRIQESMDDKGIAHLSPSELTEVLFQMLCSLPRGLEVRKGTMSVKQIRDGRLGKQLIRR